VPALSLADWQQVAIIVLCLVAAAYLSTRMFD